MKYREMTVRMQEGQAEALAAVAHADNVPIAEAIRDAIDEHIERRRADTEFQARLREMMERNRSVLERLAQ